jgi:hypothetical protein
MIRTLFAIRPRHLVLLALAVTVGACDSVDSPLGPEDAPIVVMGRVADVTPIAAAAGPALSSGSGSLAGIEVTVDGSPVSAVTDDNGHFRLEVRADDGRIRIRFRRGDLDVRLEFEGVTPGSMLQVEVSLGEHGGTVLREHHGHEGEFEGVATLVSVDGDAPSRIVRVSLMGQHGSVTVDLVEGSTMFDNEGDLTSFADLLAALEADHPALRIEGDGEIQDDGSVLATSIKAETDEHGQEGNDNPTGAGPHEFRGAATLVSVDGEAPTRTVRVSLTNDLGSVTIEVVEGSTLFDNEGDLTSFAGLLAALEASHPALRIEGDGEIQDDGSVVATSIKAETDS